MSESGTEPGALSGTETVSVGVVVVAGAVAPVVEHVVEAVWKLGSTDWAGEWNSGVASAGDGLDASSTGET